MLKLQSAAGAETQPIKSPHATPASYIGESVIISATLFLIQLPTNAPDKAANDGPSASALLYM